MTELQVCMEFMSTYHETICYLFRDKHRNITRLRCPIGLWKSSRYFSLVSLIPPCSQQCQYALECFCNIFHFLIVDFCLFCHFIGIFCFSFPPKIHVNSKKFWIDTWLTEVQSANKRETEADLWTQSCKCTFTSSFIFIFLFFLQENYISQSKFIISSYFVLFMYFWVKC